MDGKHKNSIKNIIFFDTIDSTNNYASQVIADEVSEHGLVILTNHQTLGRGQRRNKWADDYGKSLLMSLILHQPTDTEHIFTLNKIVAISIVSAINHWLNDSVAYIKWPNDIIIKDKKVGGVLIENQIKGNLVNYSIIGIGINLAQMSFPEEMPHATSIIKSCDKLIDRDQLLVTICDNILEQVSSLSKENIEQVNQRYEAMLWKGGKGIFIKNNNTKYMHQVDIKEIDEQGCIHYLLDEVPLKGMYGDIQWSYDS